ncbi:MAG: Maf-like protein [bacterium]|nr:MAG: Maf-like protein [bacterium]
MEAERIKVGKIELALASASPRRSEILASLGLRFTVDAANIDEVVLPGESSDEMVRRLALGKAETVAGRRRNSLVIGADSIVTINGRIIGKPESAEHAGEILSSLSGKTHEVITGMAFVRAVENLKKVLICRSSVTFYELGKEKINDYISTGEYKGKAGAYAIQGRGAELVKSYDGSFTNIVGLPIRELLRFIIGYGMTRLAWKTG